MPGDTQPPDGDTELDRWTLIRDVAVLQVKLIVDGLRDFILVPISLVAGLISLFRAGDPTGNEFYRLLRIGRRSERWINLFGAADRAPDPAEGEMPFPEEDIDAIVGRVEAFVVDEYRKGGVTRQAKDRLDRAIESLNQMASRRQQTRR
jgi:hypothetical protein